MRTLSFLPSFASLRRIPLAPVAGLAQYGQWLALAMAALIALFADQGQALPMARWKWMDVLGEGSVVLMLGVWLLQVRASRPAGRVTTLLCLGLGLMLLGQWGDVLDEFWKLPKEVLWDNYVESGLAPLGMVLLTWGLHLWRQEQLVLNESLRRRERLFREHRSLDGLTQLGDAGYMQAQIELERQAGRSGMVLMLGWTGFDRVLREQGLAEAERMLQTAGQLLLLHLRRDDLLCRYAADRFVVLLPGCDGGQAWAIAQDLQAALAGFAYPVSDGGARLRLPVRMALQGLDDGRPASELLLGLVELLA